MLHQLPGLMPLTLPMALEGGLTRVAGYLEGGLTRVPGYQTTKHAHILSSTDSVHTEQVHSVAGPPPSEVSHK